MTSASFHNDHAGHVVVIDDDESIRRSLYTLLTHEGYMVCLHASADEFLQNTVQPSPAVILSDMRMPGRTGVDLQAELKLRGVDMPIVFVSGDSRPEEIIQAMKQGAVDFLLKPFSARSLIDVMQNAMQIARQRMAHTGRQAEVSERLQRLTPRELEICQWMVRGYSNQQISVVDGAAAATIKLHRARVMEKMEATNLPALIEMLSGTQLPVASRTKSDQASVED
jgi:two-component system response regulator FixJ